MKKAAAILALVMLASGCAATAEDSSGSSSEEALTSLTVLDQVAPGEVAAAFAKNMNAALKQCIAAHPDIRSVDASNLDRFEQIGDSTFAMDLKETIQGLLETRTSIPVNEVGALIEPWANAKLAAHVDAAGNYVATDADLLFYDAEVDAREANAFALATAPGGKDFASIRGMWRTMQRERDNLDSAWLNPVKTFGGEPSLTQIKKQFHVPYQAQLTAWGNDAVDGFAGAEEGPNHSPRFAELGAFLKSNAIQKRWLFQTTNSDWSTNVLVVLDDHGQLWGLQMGYSK
jgi:hypothetical protein